MRVFAFTAMFLSVLCLYSISSAQNSVDNTQGNSAEKTQYVEIKTGFANIYEELDPTSPIIEQAKKGDTYELVFSGTSWYRIKVKDRQGWVEKKAGDLTDNPKKFPIFSIFLLLIIIGGTVGGVFTYIKKTKVDTEEV